MLPRQAYLPYAATRAVYDHFAGYAPPNPEELWFEHDDRPLRWHVPIGVLFDHAVGLDDGRALPWRLVAHFSNFPVQTLLRGGGLRADTTAVGASYLNALKESSFLRFGGTQLVMALPADTQRRLQRAVELARFNEFAAVSAALVPAGVQSDERRRKTRAAVRVFPAQGPWLQPSLSLRADDGRSHTLCEVLRIACPDAFADGASARCAIVHGLPAPLDAPLDWLCAACAHADGFLYVVLHAAVVMSDDSSDLARAG
jgi:hypothetical protein